MKPIIVKTIPHKSQRYNTTGDYFEKNGDWLFFVSKSNKDEEFLTLIHELTEWYLTQKRGISEKSITKFDIESGLEDPGASKKAPYHKEHLIANKVEKLVSKYL